MLYFTVSVIQYARFHAVQLVIQESQARQNKAFDTEMATGHEKLNRKWPLNAFNCS